uniref:Uncharacterized protein n=1 Tax=Anopheles minimus TaxID=112268 RepID=A0A182W697_9DIPT
MRLVECLRGAARDAVESKLMLPNAAPLIMKVLEKLFGKPSQLIRQLIEKVQKMEAPKPEKLNDLVTFGLEVQNLCDHLRLNHMNNHFNNPVLLEDLLGKLPATRQLEWSRFQEKYEKPNLKEFGAFMEKLVDEVCAVTVYVPPKVDHRRTSKGSYSPLHTNAAEPESTSVPTGLKVSGIECLVCAIPGHGVRHCERFKRIGVKERLETPSKMQLCSTCLNRHESKPCRSRFTCRVAGCNDRHNTLLHDEPRSKGAVS